MDCLLEEHMRSFCLHQWHMSPRDFKLFKMQELFYYVRFHQVKSRSENPIFVDFYQNVN